ncbi:hypothetical protein D3C84_605930 [compost metagenome]
MTPEEEVLAEIRKTIGELPREQQLAVHRSAQQLREFLQLAGGVGQLALALVGAEMAA